MLTDGIFATKMADRVSFALVCLLIAGCVYSKDGCEVIHRTDSSVLMDCSHMNLTSFSDVDVSDVTTLDVSFNQLSEWRASSLSDVTSLRQLNLSHNALQELGSRAFQGLEVLETLDLSYNHLTALPSTALTGLHRLQRLALDHNQLVSLTGDAFQHLTQLLHLELSHNDLATLNSEVLQRLSQLRHLDLGNNHLQVVLNNTFSALPHLSWLGLRSNRLERLEAGAMTGLGRLINLDLTYNRLQLTSSAYPPGVFASLRQLQVLHMEHNVDDTIGEYPDDVFTDLVSLTTLSIDTFSQVHFGPQFAALGNIHTLDLMENCRINHLANDSLQGFRNSTLAVIKFRHCAFQIVETCAFCDLPSLDKLWVYEADFQTPNKILEALYGLQHQAMTEIKLYGVGQHLSFSHVIDSHSARFLRNVCVKTFVMSFCGVQRVTGNAFTVADTPFFACLQDVDLSSNPLIGDLSTLFKLLLSHGPLRSLQVQDRRTYSISQARCLVSKNFRCKDYLSHGGYSERTFSSVIRTPENLTLLNLSSIFPHANPMPLNVTLPTAKRLRSLDLSYLGLANCRTTFYGLQNLQTLSLNGNYCYNLTETMLDHMASLQRLALSNLGLDPAFLTSRGWRFFQNVHRLQFLDLSRNELPFADPDMLRAQRRLKELDFSENRLQRVPVNLDNHADLRTLDLSHNFLTSLTSSERAALDRLASRHDFSLKLAGNPLECACFNLDVVQWLWHTPVSLDGEGRQANYTCTSETGEITSTERVMAQWMAHWRRCVGVQIFGIALSAFLLQVLAIVVVFVTVRSWTQLCYAWKTLRRLRLPRRHHFLRDAYVVYSDAERDVRLACVTLRECLEEQHGVRLLLRDREELPGSVRAETVVQHIDISWKVVLLVTPDFSRDDWACGFTVQQAQRGITDSMPDRVIVVFLEETARLPAMPSLKMLLRMVPERNVLHVHRDTPPQHAVWRSLADLISREQ